MADLLCLGVLLTACLYWWHAFGMKEIALLATRRHLQQLDLDLLDDSVVLRAFWFKRDRQGRLRMWRTFQFEFSSTGEKRYLGRIILLGSRVEAVQLQPHRLNE